MRISGPIVALALLVGCDVATGVAPGPMDACPDHADAGGFAPEGGDGVDSGDAASEGSAEDGTVEASNADGGADAVAPDDAAPTSDASHDARALTDAPSHCDDNVLDADETDVDCGGSCPGCWLAQHCLRNHDCSAASPGCNTKLGGCSCDAISLTCVADRCIDHKKDGDESDVDCGGFTCPACGTGMICTSNGDCKSSGCDALTALCAASQCADHQRDGNETDVDCGGGFCTPCSLGMGCRIDYDCTSQACDALPLTCVADRCFDHRLDGVETDVDCGGSVCAARCATGKSCLVSSDCMSGHCSIYGQCQ